MNVYGWLNASSIWARIAATGSGLGARTNRVVVDCSLLLVVVVVVVVILPLPLGTCWLEPRRVVVVVVAAAALGTRADTPSLRLPRTCKTERETPLVAINSGNDIMTGSPVENEQPPGALDPKLKNREEYKPASF